MKKILIIIVLILILSLTLLGYFQVRIKISKSKLLDIGEKAPHFALKSTNGKSFNLDDFNGKKILIVYFTTDCSHCLRQLANLNEIEEKMREKLEIIAISGSGENKTKEFKEIYNINFPILIDDKNTFKGKYGGRGVPILYILDEEMKIKYRRVGFHSKYLDEKIISEFIRNNKIPIEIYLNDQKENFIIDNFKTSVSALRAREIALKDPEVSAFIEKNFINPEEKVENLSLRWSTKEKRYKWIIEFIALPCHCPDKNTNTLYIAKIEIDPNNEKLINRELIRELPKELYKERLYEELIGYSLLVNKEK